MLNKCLILELFPNEWENYKSEILKYRQSLFQCKSALSRQLNEDKLNNLTKKEFQSSYGFLLQEAGDIMQNFIAFTESGGFLEAFQLSKTQKETIDSLQTQVEDLTGQLKQFKEKYETNMKKMAAIIEKLNGGVKSKDDLILQLQEVLAYKDQGTQEEDSRTIESRGRNKAQGIRGTRGAAQTKAADTQRGQQAVQRGAQVELHPTPAARLHGIQGHDGSERNLEPTEVPPPDRVHSLHQDIQPRKETAFEGSC
jgi:exonuclease VII small subunit